MSRSTEMIVTMVLILLGYQVVGGCGKSEDKPMPERLAHVPSAEVMADDILIYLGFKPGESGITTISGQDFRGAGNNAARGIFMGPGVAFEQSFGLVTISGSSDGGHEISMKEGSSVEFKDGTALTYTNGVWRR